VTLSEGVKEDGGQATFEGPGTTVDTRHPDLSLDCGQGKEGPVNEEKRRQRRRRGP